MTMNRYKPEQHKTRVFVVGSEDKNAYGFNVKQSQAGYAAAVQRTQFVSILVPVLVVVTGE